MSDDRWARVNVDPNDPASPLYEIGGDQQAQPLRIETGIDSLLDPNAMDSGLWTHSRVSADLPPWAIVASVVGVSLLILWAIGDHRAVFTILAVGAPLILMILIGFRLGRCRR
jgi:hypothetical protein